MKKLSLLIVWISFGVSGVSFSQSQLEIQEGTVVRVRLLETIDSRTAKNGDIVNLETIEKIESNGITIISNGARVTGRVMNAVANKSLGRKGKLDLSIDYVKAIDGTNIPLSYTMNQSGKDATVGVIAGAVLLSPIALIVKGKSAILMKGTEFNTYISRTTKINQ